MSIDPAIARSPGRSVQDLLAADVVAPPAHLVGETWVSPGDADVERERFWSPSWHRAEVEHVWRRVWQIACREEDVPAVGDHVVYDIADDSLIVVRVAPDEIRAYLNSCLHRGSTLRDHGGRVARFVCPFHGFTWGLDGRLEVVPAAWDFPQIDRTAPQWCLPQARVDTWGGFVFVNLGDDPASLLDFLEVLPAEFAFRPLEHRWKSAHVQRVVACNWKLAMEAFAEAYHVFRTHPQAVPITGDANSQYDLWPGVRHVSRMITPLGTPSPHLERGDEDLITKALRTPGASLERPANLTARQFAAEHHRRHYETRFAADLSAYSDTEILDAIQYHVFPNFSPWAGTGQPISYLWRPNGNDPESCIMDVMYLSPLPASGERPPAAPITYLEPDQPWTDARELGKYGPVFDQDTANFARVQKGVKAGRKGNTYSIYQESKIRHFHRTLDTYVERP